MLKPSDTGKQRASNEKQGAGGKGTRRLGEATVLGRDKQKRSKRCRQAHSEGQLLAIISGVVGGERRIWREGEEVGGEQNRGARRVLACGAGQRTLGLCLDVCVEGAPGCEPKAAIIKVRPMPQKGHRATK
jgi:hypothetical protein